MSNIRVIQLASNDIQYDAAILGLLNGYAQIPMIHGQPLPPGVLDRMLPGLREHRGLIFLALDDSTPKPTPVGVATAFRGYSTFYARPLVNVHDLAVDASYQGRGIGSQLLLAIEADARASDCCKVTLEVLAENERAHALYRRLGYDQQPDGEELPASYFLQKPLRSIDTVR